MELLIKKEELSHEERLKIRNKEICQEWLDWYDRDMYKIELSKDLMKRISKRHNLAQQYIYQIR